MFRDSRSLRFSCVGFGWRTFYFTEAFMRVYHTTVYNTFSCPKCKNVLKREKAWDFGNDGCYMFLVYIFFLPIFLIIWLIKWLVKLHNEITQKSTILGEDLVFCKGCKSFVAIAHNGTRLLSRQEIEETIAPRYKDDIKFQKQYNKYLSAK